MGMQGFAPQAPNQLAKRAAKFGKSLVKSLRCIMALCGGGLALEMPIDPRAGRSSGWPNGWHRSWIEQADDPRIGAGIGKHIVEKEWFLACRSFLFDPIGQQQLGWIGDLSASGEEPIAIHRLDLPHVEDRNLQSWEFRRNGSKCAPAKKIGEDRGGERRSAKHRLLKLARKPQICRIAAGQSEQRRGQSLYGLFDPDHRCQLHGKGT